MSPITIPRLYCPFTPSVNPFAAAVTIHTDDWVRRFGLHTGAAWQKYKADNFTQLTARFYTTAGLERLAAANDLVVLLFAVDDLLDDQLQRSSLIQQKERLQAFIEQVTAITSGAAPSVAPDAMPWLAALADVWERLCAFGPPQWQQQFAKSILKMFRTAIWEFDNARGQLPTIAQYVEKRQYLGAAFITIGMIQVIEDIPLPPEVLQHPRVQEMVMLCRNIICWANDLFSLGKEQQHGDGHNLVTLLQTERNLTQDEAILCTTAMHDADMFKFLRLSKQLPSFDAATNKHLERYAGTLNRHIRGNVDWSVQDTKRYSFVYGK
ncbi:hypothetical protein F0L74_19665 [Chitinophaga agrisoli]|uniref:Terpene synthase n=1 Tax=Chitinophaga agrisoli TaxID=2607653 RepID=A0A5B2VII5_9BACT|nr:hypothetical protein [Chitinophaga agrisoli]KAA2238448.1 hypothetical protein F0L74_19665 [Chitinophaga agrisoli]